MKKQEEANKKQEENKEERWEDYEQALQQHYDMQDDKTKREMRKTYRKAANFNLRKKQFFLVRWYRSIFPKKIRKTRKKVPK